jgi:hypothetical protein
MSVPQHSATVPRRRDRFVFVSWEILLRVEEHFKNRTSQSPKGFDGFNRSTAMGRKNAKSLLLADIADAKVDVVAVYKIDRLTLGL